jgi:hypothetical protein
MKCTFCNIVEISMKIRERLRNEGVRSNDTISYFSLDRSSV